MRKLAFLALAGLALSGCANQLLSDDAIRDKTAFVLNQPASAVTISDRRYDGATETRYVAHTSKGAYSCVINGGTVMAFGMTNPPTCLPGANANPSDLPPWARQSVNQAMQTYLTAFNNQVEQLVPFGSLVE